MKIKKLCANYCMVMAISVTLQWFIYVNHLPNLDPMTALFLVLGLNGWMFLGALE